MYLYICRRQPESTVKENEHKSENPHSLTQFVISRFTTNLTGLRSLEKPVYPHHF